MGLLAPGVSFAITGFPVAAVLPAMTVELAVYGLLTGLLVDRTRLGRFASVALALVAGRLVFIAAAVLTGYLSAGFGTTKKSNSTNSKSPKCPGTCPRMLSTTSGGSRKATCTSTPWWARKKSSERTSARP